MKIKDLNEEKEEKGLYTIRLCDTSKIYMFKCVAI